MSAQLFFVPLNAVLYRGLPQAGATATFYLAGTTTKASVYSSNTLTTLLSNPVVADATGVLPSIYLDSTILYRVVIKDILGDTIVDVDNYIPGTYLSYQGTAGVNGAVGSSAGNAALFTAAGGMTIGAGITRFRTAGYREPGKGAAEYIKWVVPLAALPAVGAGENAWWFTDAAGGKWYPDPENLHLYQFGAYCDAAQYGNSPSSDHDDYPAFLAFKSFALWGRTSVNAKAASIPKLRLPNAICYSSQTWEFDFGTVHLEAGIHGNEQGGRGFSLRTADGKDGIVVDNDNTSGGTSRASVPGAEGSTFTNIEVWTRGAAASTTACGIRAHTAVYLNFCSVWNFIQDGVNIVCTAGGGGLTEGNASLFMIIGGDFYFNGRDGIRTQGADANAGNIIGANFKYNGEWGYGGREFLGNTLTGCHSASNARRGEAGPTYAKKTSVTSVSYGGNVYSVRFGQEVGASTNAPTGTATSNTWWLYRSAGAPATLNPLWVSGTTIVSGGAYLAADSSSRTLLNGCYSESDQPGSWLSATSMAIGGLHAAGIQGNYLQAMGGVISVQQGIGVYNTADDGTITSAHLGSPSVDPAVLMEFGRSTTSPNDWRMKVTTGQDWLYDYQSLGGSSPFWVMGPSKTQADDRYRAAFVDLLLGATDDTSSIKLGASSAMPSTGYYRAGSFVHSKGATVSAGKILLGWKRLVTGSAHVLNTDWCACYATTT